jgi:hypothetical protein
METKPYFSTSTFKGKLLDSQRDARAAAGAKLTSQGVRLSPEIRGIGVASRTWARHG